MTGMAFVLRRSLPSMAALVGLLLLVGLAAGGALGAPGWFPVAFAVVALGIQFVVNPWIVQWLVPADVIDHDGSRYLTDHPVGAIVARRCRDAGIPLVKLGIVNDGTPNAFTFGRTPGDARMWLTLGLVERLDEDELDAVVAHEVGHIKHWDFAVMTLAAVVPMVLYLVYLLARGSDREGKAIAAGAYVAYVVSQLIVLSLSRAREYGADHWSCQCTGKGDALASALVKIAYGMGQERAAEKERAAELVGQGKHGAKLAAKEKHRRARVESLRAMGIFEPKAADTMAAAVAGGGGGLDVDPERAVAAMRWDVANPWGATLEKLSTHPLVARRILALEESGLPGAPVRWSVRRSMALVPEHERWAARGRFARDLVVAVAPWLVLITSFMWWWTSETARTGPALGLALGGALLVVKQLVRYPMVFKPAPEVAGLLERLDASPVGGIGVEVRGRIIGRGMPGYVLSPDLVVQDESGFVPLFYNQPIPFARALFGLFRAERFLGEEVVARGWYRRSPGPVLELREVRILGPGGRRARAWMWLARYVCSAALAAIGVLTLAAVAAGS